MIWSILALGMTVVLVVVYEIRLARAYKETDAFKRFFHEEAELANRLAEEVGYLQWKLDGEPPTSKGALHVLMEGGNIGIDQGELA